MKKIPVKVDGFDTLIAQLGLLTTEIRSLHNFLQQSTQHDSTREDEAMASMEEAIAANTAAVEEQTSVVGSVSTLIGGMADQLETLAAELETAGVDPAQVEAVHALAASTRANTQMLVEAVEANVPPHIEHHDDA